MGVSIKQGPIEQGWTVSFHFHAHPEATSIPCFLLLKNYKPPPSLLKQQKARANIRVGKIQN